MVKITDFTAEEMAEIREQFYFVDEDFNGEKRLFFDNAGGSLRLKKAEEAFHQYDCLPDCSEHSNRTALYLEKVEAQGKADLLKTVFNAKNGVLFVGLTASQVMMECVRVLSDHAVGTNFVTTILEHPSSFDSIKNYSGLHGMEMRVAGLDPKTGGVNPQTLIDLVDENTAVLSVMAASNFSGYVHDVETVFREAKKKNPNIFLICDAVQHAPHAHIDPEKIGADIMTFAPYKFFGIRGMGVGYVSNRVASFMHHRLLGTFETDWQLGSPAPAHYAAVTEIVNYVAELGRHIAPEENDRRTLFEIGMDRIALHERILLKAMSDGTENVPGLKDIPGVKLCMNDAPLESRDLIIGVEFDNLSCKEAAKEYEKRHVVAYERSPESIYSKRMVDAIGSTGVVRLSPLHVNTIEEIEEFLCVTKEIASI